MAYLSCNDNPKPPLEPKLNKPTHIANNYDATHSYFCGHDDHECMTTSLCKTHHDSAIGEIPHVVKIIIFSGNDERHVNQLTIDFKTMKYVVSNVADDASYTNSFGNRPREIDMLITHHNNKVTKVYFHKGIVYYAPNVNMGRDRYFDDDNILDTFHDYMCSHIKNYTIANNGVKLVIERGNESVINITKMPYTSEEISVKLDLECDADDNSTRYVNICPCQFHH